MKFATIKEAIEDLQKGKFIITVDDEKRENEGDVVIAAEKAAPEKLNWMIHHARGILCVPMESSRLHALKIPLMVQKNTDKFKTPFAVSVDLKEKTTTGVSVADRAETISALVNKKSKASDFTRPGHIFPLMAKKKGVLERQGHTEAAVDLCKLSGLYPAAVIAEIMNEDGSMAKLPQLFAFAKKHKLKIVTIKDLVDYIVSGTNF